MGLIIGARSDPHVSAVVEAGSREMVVVDAESFTTDPVTLTETGLTIGETPISEARGWIRRLAPPGWSADVNVGTLGASVKAAALSGLAAVVRDERIEWLTHIERLGATENKPHQYRRISAVGIPVPPWLVTTDPSKAPMGGLWVSKPLGPGWFIDDSGREWTVPTTPFDPTTRASLAGCPFLIQRCVDAATHARVVTVGNEAFSATLPSQGLPTDWRLSPDAHSAFTPAPAPDHVHAMAIAAACVVNIGYSAQDWICDQEGSWWFVDLNPAGQWLFLPAEVAAPITEAIARFLDPDS
jgi:hypothetical protein